MALIPDEKGRFSRFVAPLPEYLHLNRMVDYIALHQIVRAGDGEHFDRHFDHILAQAQDPEYGVALEAISALERDHGGPLKHRARPAQKWPCSFAMLQAMATAAGKDEFVAALMGPSGVQIPLAKRPFVDCQPLRPLAPELRPRFADDHLIQFDSVFDRAFMQEMAAQVAVAPFRELRHVPLGIDHSMDFGPTQAMLQFAITDVELVGLMEYVARINPGTVDRFSGRIYQMAWRRDRDDYHNDVQRNDRRLVAISVCLTPSAPVGGALVMRRKGFLRSFGRSRPAGLGETVVFRIARALEHKVADVRGPVSRTNLAGWYCAAGGFDYERWLDAPCFEASGGRVGLRRWLARR